jgi:hypothetical protein
MEANMDKSGDCTAGERVITFDLNKITVKEWRAFLGDITVEIEDSLIERAAGLEPGALSEMGLEDWNTVTRAFYAKIKAEREAKN